MKRDHNMWRMLWSVLLLMPLTVMAQVVTDEEVTTVDSLQESTLEMTADSLLTDTLAIDPSLVWPNNVCARLDNLLKSSMFKTTTVGIQVYDLTADSILYQYNEKQCMRPASTMKMLNAVTSLDKLGGSYLFKTEMRYTGQIDSCTLRGNIYCKGGMDPLFNIDDMRAFVDALLKKGIDTIRGRVYADVSMKDRDLLGEGWCWDDDNPVLSPLLIGKKNNFMKRLCQVMKEEGIVFIGDTLQGMTPANAYHLCTRTHTMDQVLMRMMKNSDNLFAESMFYQLAASTGAKGVTAKNGREMVNRLITKLGFRPSDYYVADGSGLSLYNYVSPELEVAFLRYAYANDHIYPHLITAMPIAGVDGTLEKRMRSGFAHTNVKAKTGTVTGVSALTGYCTSANGHLLCFSIINMGIRKADIGRNFQDHVCEALCKP